MALGRLPRAARLKRRRLIKPLFARRLAGHDGSAGQVVRSTASGCVRVLYRLAPRSETGQETPVQVGFVVPKRVRRAVDRNRIKRQMRAGFQSESARFLSIPVPEQMTLTMMAIFRGDVTPGATLPDIARDTKRAVERVVAEIAHTP